MDTWTLTFTDANGRIGRRIYDNETAFISAVLDKLTDPGTSNYWRSCLRERSWTSRPCGGSCRMGQGS